MVLRRTSLEDELMEGVPTHGGKYMEYSINGSVFEIPLKYTPPFNPIGRGAYGVVCSALNSETNELIAVKKICNVFDTMIDAKRTYRELRLLRHMDHENIIAIKDIFPPPTRHAFNDVYVSFDLMDMDLAQLIACKQPLSDEHCQYFLYQILRGLKYIHSANVIHRDLKPGNLLIKSNCDLKIADFGMARSVVEEEECFMTEYVVTRWYRAPELLLHSGTYTSAIDIWSVGCIMMELFNKEPLFPGRNYVHQLRSIIQMIGLPDDSQLERVNCDNAMRYIKQLPRYEKQPLQEKFPNISPLALDLVDKMLTFDPRSRISAEDALAHPYLSSLHGVCEEPNCPSPFFFGFDERKLTESEIRKLIYKEALHFNPHFVE